MYRRIQPVPAKLSTIGRLVRTIVPQADAVAIFDRYGQLLWATDAEEHEDLRALATDLMADAERGGPTNSMRYLHNAPASYAFVMREAAGQVTGALTLTIAGPYQRANLLLPPRLESRLAPLLAAGAVAEPDTISRLLRVLARRIQADTIIVSVPGQNIEHRFSQPSTELTDIDGLRDLVSSDLAGRAESDIAPRRVDDARTGPSAPAFSYLSIPLRRQRALLGLLVAFAAHSRRPFSAQDTEFLRSSAATLVRLLN
jgi:GAF domain-containing protein